LYREVQLHQQLYLGRFLPVLLYRGLLALLGQLVRVDPTVVLRGLAVPKGRLGRGLLDPVVRLADIRLLKFILIDSLVMEAPILITWNMLVLE
jgi:hypothetical protein